MPTIPLSLNNADAQFTGYIHMALSVGSKARVDELTAKLRQDGYPVVSEPRRTGDGYYESCVLDPDGNRIEITV
jgi:lactoylglutathione lyase